MSADSFDLAVSTAIQELLVEVSTIGMTLVGFIIKMQTIPPAEIPLLLSSLKDQASEWCDSLDLFERTHRSTLLQDETHVAASGGRNSLGDGIVLSDRAMPISAALQMGRAHALFFLALLTTHQRVMEYLTDKTAQIPASRITGARIFTGAMTKLDDKIDNDLCNLGWDTMRAQGLVRASPEIQAKGLRTCSDIVDSLNHVRTVWKTSATEESSVEGFGRVLLLALGRLSVRTLSQTAEIMQSTNPYPSNPDLLDVKMYRTPAKRLASAMFADFWLSVGSMEFYRYVVLRVLIPQTDTDLYASWQLTVDNQHQISEMKITDDTDLVYLLPKDKLMEWAYSVARTIANEDKIMTAVIKALQADALMVGDRLLHAAYCPNEDSRSAECVQRWRDGMAFVRSNHGDSPKKVLGAHQDPDKDVATAECFVQILDYMNQNYGGEKSMREQCIYHQDGIERLGEYAANFIIPVILQVHGQWVVTIEGCRTPVCTFMTAVMTWLRTCLRLEKKGVSTIRISPVVRLMTKWMIRERELATLGDTLVIA